MRTAIRFSGRKASSLITTLLVLVVLSTIVVAFMQSMAVERTTAKSAKNAYVAQLAAESGLTDAANRLASLMLQNPYHAIGYTNVGGEMITTLVGKPSYYSNATVVPGTNYLLSVANPTNLPTGLNATNSVAVNVKNSAGLGWMGSPVTNGAIVYRQCRAPWIYILKDPSLPNQPDPGEVNYNPYVARYAYWVEDETSKIDFRMAGNANGALGAFLRGTNASVPSDVDIGAVPLLSGAAIATNNATANQQLIAFRNSITNLPVDGRVLGQAKAVSTNAVEPSRFYTTMASYSSDLAGTGRKRVNLNALVTGGTSAEQIAGNLDDIIFVITGSHYFPSATTNRAFGGLPNSTVDAPIPTFGERFYAAVPAANRPIYLKKIAANIRDYIDLDSYPTIVDQSGNVQVGPPTSGWWNNWPPQAMGKEAIPYLQETTWTGFEESFSASSSTRTATIEIDHYLEFFNPSTKAFVAPAGTKIEVSNMPSWSAGSYPAIEPEDFTLDISGVTFPAGRVTVITTGTADPPGLIQDSTTVVRKTPSPASARRFANRLTNEDISGVKGFQNSPGTRSSTVSDTESRIMFSGTSGVYLSFPCYGYTVGNSQNFNFKGEWVGNRVRFVYDTSLSGNNGASNNDGKSGDPRSLAEQLQFQAFDSSYGDNSRFYGNLQGNVPIPGNSTMGKASMTYVDPTKTTGAGAWGDYNPAFNDTAATAYAVVRDGPMLSIGELGNIYDPYRMSSQSGITAARGGGRTLKVGQPEDVMASTTRFSANWQKSAWRLADFFGVSTSGQLELDPVGRGKINVNSVTRDDGVALRGLLRKFEFLASPDSDSALSGKMVSDADMQNLIAGIKGYITTNGPFMERGELSQLPFFSGASGNVNTIAAKTVTTMNDRGREELFRRLAELITTRSSSYSIYAVGEAVQQSKSGAIKPLSRAKEGFVYRFDPVVAGLRDKATAFNYQKLYELE